MTRLNIELPDECVDVINMFAVSNKHQIEEKYGKSTQSTVVQLILSYYMNENKLNNYVDMLENNKE